MRVPVRLVRFVSFDGQNLRFFESANPMAEETLPLDPAYHSVAMRIERHRLCKVIAVNGVVVSLEPMLPR